uniref:Secreted protein n=1 Tax=Octopus bimaculoides TaxID=37653 RepID=A0A0L8GAQ5_OCTBM
MFIIRLVIILLTLRGGGIKCNASLWWELILELRRYRRNQLWSVTHTFLQSLQSIDPNNNINNKDGFSNRGTRPQFWRWGRWEKGMREGIIQSII